MHIHFIAIGGAAMHNLALAMAAKPGYIVTGSDDEIFEPARSRLMAKSLLPKHIGWLPEQITSDIDAVILGMHAREDNPELLKARELGLKIYSFPEYLYEQTKDKIRIVVGGSHGKTTTTAMILYALKKLNIEADYMVGAQIEGFDNMVGLSDTAKFAVFEGDEYLSSPLDRRSKFHLYHPHIAILTGIAWDHINVFPTFEKYVGTFRTFANLIEPNGKLIYYKEDSNLVSIASEARTDISCIPYDTPQYTIEQGVTYLGREHTPLRIFGKHNLQNLQAAALACAQIGITEQTFFNALSDFTGASNRLEKIVETPDSVAFKDFAHSPSKLRATIDAVREQYPNRRLVACMELHTFSSLTADFLPQYFGCMQKADVAFVYFNPKVIEHKHLQTITKEEVRQAFGTDNITVFTEVEAMKTALEEMDFHNKVLLMMTSGTYDGIDIKQFATNLIQK